MKNQSKIYVAIDLKSFYASVECVERGLDPLTTNLVVADPTRTDKTICLAVSPALKTFGTGGRPRLFEVVQRVREVNNERGRVARLTGKSININELREHPELAVDYLVAPPRMAHYIKYSSLIYSIYLKYVAAEDVHVYSIDEVFIDVTPYLATYRMTAHELAMTMIRDVLEQTGVTATAGIGTNMYLAKVAMDIVAKKMAPDADGVRIAELDEMSYRRQLWDHTPLTDFWRVGPGIQRRLARIGLYTMGDVARASLTHEQLLFQQFGVNAELLIDHAWGWEPCTIAQVKAYRPETRSISSGQVLQEAYPVANARIVALEMAEGVALELLDKHLVTSQIVLTVGYDVESLTRPGINYTGEVHIDRYGRRVPKHAQGTAHLARPTFSARAIMDTVAQIFDNQVNPALLVRRITIAACNLVYEDVAKNADEGMQLDLFTDYDQWQSERQAQRDADDKERRLMTATLELKRRFGKNSILKGLNFHEGSTARDRNRQIGGHRE